jgi:hypothetical protein
VPLREQRIQGVAWGVVLGIAVWIVIVLAVRALT